MGPTVQALCAPQPSQGALQVQEVLGGRAAPPEELGVWQCWEPCCSSHTFTPPRAPAPRTAPALAPGRAPGAAFVRRSRIPSEAAAQGPVAPVPLTSPMEPLVPRAGASVRHCLSLSSARTKARAVKGGGKRSVTDSGLGAWSAGEGPRRLLSSPRGLPPARCHIYLSRSRALPWLAAALLPLRCSRQCWAGGSALHPGGRAGCAPRRSPRCGGTDQPVVLTGTGQQRGGLSQHKHNVSLCLSCVFGCCLGSLSGSSSGLKRLLL